MTKLRITITTVVEYTPNPSHYDDQSPEAMLASNIEGATDDPYLFMERDGAVTTVTGEVIG